MAGFASFPSVLLISSLLVASYACASEVELDYSSLPIVKGLSWSFYDSSCPKLESVIRKELKKIFKKDIGQSAGLLRLHFHDCFVQGCDGSVLLDGSTSGPSEQDAPPNLSLRATAFEIIDDLRERVHKQCGRVVSCADITALAARDSVFLAGGPDYNVPLGRKDGLTFATREVTLANLPAPTSNASVILDSLATKKLDATDVVALSGGHTIGIGHCGSFNGRLYPTQDPTMDKTFAKDLKQVCPTLDSNGSTVLDIRSPNKFDNKYYVNLMNRQGLFTSDQDLYTDKRTKDIVTSFAVDEDLFFKQFAKSMIKMGQLSVLTGKNGEIRANCSVRNSDNINELVSISYPGIPSSPPFGSYGGSGPSGSAGDLPISANFDKKNQRMNLKTIAIIALSAFVLLLVLIGAVSIFLKWRKVGRPSSAVGPALTSPTNKRCGIGSILSSSIASSTSVSLMSTMATRVLSAKTFTLAELEKATDKFSSKRILGEGGFGRVYCGNMEDGTEVAVKLLTRDNQNGDREFIAEVEMLSRLHHRNLVKLIGICIEGQTRCLVYELIHNGSVESHLHGVDKKKGPLDWDARLKIALGAARGLAYLHEDSNPRVIHRDFKASNVLLEEDFTPKVSDFGLAREATEGSDHISTRVMGTFGYVAPEYAMTGHLLVKSDVYSYGVVLLELLTGRKPVDMSQPQGQENLVTWARPLLTSREGLEQLVDPSLAGSYDFDDMAKVAAIASMCVHPEVTQRPFMGEVVQALKLIYNDTDETCGDCCSQKESSARDSDFKGDFVPSDSSWWNAGGLTPRLNYGHASSFITMDYSSGPLEDMENRPFSTSTLVGGEMSLPIRHGNRSGPLRTVRSKAAFYRFSGSRSEHGGLLPKRSWNDGSWV